MKNVVLTTLAVVTLTMVAGDARAQGGFFSSLFGLSPRPVSNTSYYGTTYPATNCSNGRCTTTQYGPTWNNRGSYGSSTGNGYSNTYPAYYAPGSTNTGNWTTPNVLPASYNNCPGGYCPTTPATRPTTPYQTTPYTPVNYTAPSYHTPQYNTPTYNTPTYNNGPYYNSY